MRRAGSQLARVLRAGRVMRGATPAGRQAGGCTGGGGGSAACGTPPQAPGLAGMPDCGGARTWRARQRARLLAVHRFAALWHVGRMPDACTRTRAMPQRCAPDIITQVMLPHSLQSHQDKAKRQQAWGMLASGAHCLRAGACCGLTVGITAIAPRAYGASMALSVVQLNIYSHPFAEALPWVCGWRRLASTAWGAVQQMRTFATPRPPFESLKNDLF